MRLDAVTKVQAASWNPDLAVEQPITRKLASDLNVCRCHADSSPCVHRRLEKCKNLYIKDALQYLSECEASPVASVRHFVEVSKTKRRLEPYLVESVLVIRIGERFASRDTAWEFACSEAGWGKKRSSQCLKVRSRLPMGKHESGVVSPSGPSIETVAQFGTVRRLLPSD